MAHATVTLEQAPRDGRPCYVSKCITCGVDSGAVFPNRTLALDALDGHADS